LKRRGNIKDKPNCREKAAGLRPALLGTAGGFAEFDEGPESLIDGSRYAEFSAAAGDETVKRVED